MKTRCWTGWADNFSVCRYRADHDCVVCAVCVHQPQNRLQALGFAVGGNATAAQLCGINVRRVRILIFTLSGLLAAVTGILLAARLGSGNAGAANGLEFDVIAAVVVGGTALSGGRGSCSVHCLVCW